MSGNSHDTSLSHLVYGAGDPCVVMIPPNPCDLTYWSHQQARYSNWYTTLSVDLPGYGFSPTAAEGMSLEDLARRIWSVIDVYHDGPVVVIGVSMGSTLALHMRWQDPDRVDGLVLSGCSYRPVKSFAARRAEGYLQHGIGYRETHLRDGFSERYLKTAEGARVLREILERNRHVNVQSVVRLFEAHAQPDPEDMFDVPGPVLIISGQADYAHDGAWALAQRIANSRIETIEGAGHACSIEALEEFDRLALDFIADLAAGPV